MITWKVGHNNLFKETTQRSANLPMSRFDTRFMTYIGRIWFFSNVFDIVVIFISYLITASTNID